MNQDTEALDTAAIEQYFKERLPEVLSLARALVEIESPSGDEQGSKAVVALLASAARSIDSVSTIEKISSADYGEHLRLRAFDQEEAKPIIILGHTDTVHPRGSLLQRPWRIDGNRAYGPGVFDMKANCALALESIRACTLLGLKPRRPLVLLLTCDEERGSGRGRSLVEAEAVHSEAVLVLEPPAAGGRVKTGRKGTASFTLETRGRAAHAGLEPEKGVSAILELARQIQRLHDLNGKADGISVNVGVIKGGTVPNVVPAEAWAEVDIRFSTSTEAQRVEELFKALQPFDHRVQLIVQGEINRPPLERDERVLALFEKAREIARTFGYELGEAQVGGASDGNFAAAVGASVLDGLGLDGDGAHAVHEHILIEDIPRRGALLTALLATV